MIVEFAFILFLCMVLEISMQNLWTKKMHKLKIEQVTKEYGPCWHEKTKMGTPTMGGIVFIPVLLVAVCIIFFIDESLSCGRMLQVVSYPILAAGVGLLDDWLKYSKHSSDGLKSMQKLLLQVVVTLPWAFWMVEGPFEILPNIILPTLPSVFLVTFIGVGLQNGVNVTDGLDGLASGCALISFIGAALFIASDPLIALVIAAACGIALGFLWHNANPATVFMGDVGAHFFAGLLLAVCLASGALIMIIPLCFLFGIEILSVSIQIFSIRCFKKKVFLMSPIHHHFEMLGWKETQIVTRFWIIHMVGMTVCVSLLFLLVHLI